MIGISVVDGTYYPLPLALEVQNGRAKAPDMTGNHKLLVISEEQFKVSHALLLGVVCTRLMRLVLVVIIELVYILYCCCRMACIGSI